MVVSSLSGLNIDNSDVILAGPKVGGSPTTFRLILPAVIRRYDGSREFRFYLLRSFQKEYGSQSVTAWIQASRDAP